MFGKKQREIDELRSELKGVVAQRGTAINLAEGCRKHPSYRAVRKPTANCDRCKRLFELRRALNIIGLAMRSGKRGKQKSHDYLKNQIYPFALMGYI